MTFVYSPVSFDDALWMLEQQVDCISVGCFKFATRISFDCDLQKLKKLIASKKDSKIFVQVNAWIFDKDLDALEQYLFELKKLDIDAIVFSDYAIAEINLEHNLNLNLIYNSETAVTSAGQFEFFYDNKINGVFLARELFFAELKMISMQNDYKLKLMVQGHGLLFIMHSRWNLISNFDNYIKDYSDERLKDSEMIYIRETLRKYPNILIEDEHGTHMFSGYELATINILDKLQSINIDYLWINNYKHTPEQSQIITNLYQQAKQLLNNQTYDQQFKDDAWNQLQKTAHNNIITNNFLGTVKDILNMQKEEENDKK